MSDPRLDTQMTLGDSTYILRFTHTALGLAEKATGKTVSDLAMMFGAGRFGFHDLSCLAFAGLEGARIKLKLHHKPWTLEKTQNVLDDADNFEAIAGPVVEAFDAALRKWFPDEYAEADDAKAKLDEGDEGPSGTGTVSSEQLSV